MRSSHPLLLSLAVVAGCAGPTPPPPATVTVSVEATPPARAAPPRALPPTPARCHVATAEWRAAPQRWSLLLDPEGPHFGHILPERDGVASVTLEGERSAGTYRFEGRVMVLEGWVDPASVKLFSEDSVTFEGVIRAAAARPLAWEATRSRREVVTRLAFRPWGQPEMTLAAPVVCERLRLRPPDVEPPSFDGSVRVVRGDGPLEVRAEADGPVRLTLPAPKWFADVVELEARGQLRRVASEIAPDVWLVGWIDGSRLELPNGGRGVGCGVGRGRLRRRRWSHTTTCTRPVPLHVELAGERRRVGKLQAGAPFHQRESDDGFTRITPEDDDVRLVGEARWLVPETELEAHCVRRRR